MKFILVRAINWFADVLIMLLFARAILSWFARDPYSTVGKIYMVTIRLTEPIVTPARALLRKLNLDTGMLDLSVFLAFFLVQIVARLLSAIVFAIFI